VSSLFALSPSLLLALARAGQRLVASRCAHYHYPAADSSCARGRRGILRSRALWPNRWSRLAEIHLVLAENKGGLNIVIIHPHWPICINGPSAA